MTVDRSDATWNGHVGVVTRQLARLAPDPLNTVAMICGPEIMMRFAALELRKLSLSPEQIFVSMERNMNCAVGFCGHCQYGPHFVCEDGPIFRYDRVMRLMAIREA